MRGTRDALQGLCVGLLALGADVAAAQDALEASGAAQEGSALLGMSIEELLEVEVTTAAKREQPIADVPASVVVLTREDIERYGYTTLEEILANVPGMYLVDTLSPYRPTFGVRGYWSGNPRNVFFLVNGVSQEDPIFTFHLIPNMNIPVEAIDRIEVIRGPMAVTYGGGAFFGAINIITSGSTEQKPTTIVAGAVGNYESRRASIRAAGRKDDLRYSFTAGISDTEGIDEPLSRMSSNPYALPGVVRGENDRTGGRLEQNTVHLNTSLGFGDFTADISYNHSRGEVYWLAPSTTSGSQTIRRMARGQLGYQRKLTNWLQLNGRLTYHHSTTTAEFDIYSTAYSGESNSEAQAFDGEVSANWSWKDRLLVITGFAARNVQHSRFRGQILDVNLDLLTEADDYQTVAGFLEADYHLLPSLRFVAGLRIEDMTPYDIRARFAPGTDAERPVQGRYDGGSPFYLPRAAVLWSLSDAHVLKLLYGEAAVRPSFFQSADQVTSGRPSLNAERIRTLELNYVGGWERLLNVSSSLFYNQLDNLIVRTVSGTPGAIVYYNNNGGKLRTLGGELTVNVTPIAGLSTELSVTYQRSKDLRAGMGDEPVEYSPHLLGYAKASYHFLRWFTVALTGRYVGRMYARWDVGRLNPDGTLNPGRIGLSADSYALLDASLRVADVFDHGFYLAVHVTNLFNTKFLYPAYVDNLWTDKGLVGQPLTVMATLGRKF